MRDTRLEEGGELNVEGTCRGEGKRGASFQMQKQEKEGKLPPFFAFFFFSIIFFSMFFFSGLKRKKQQQWVSSFLLFSYFYLK
jgi:hypothetical protein